LKLIEGEIQKGRCNSLFFEKGLDLIKGVLKERINKMGLCSILQNIVHAGLLFRSTDVLRTVSCLDWQKTREH
jgi:hypothetical protein